MEVIYTLRNIHAAADQLLQVVGDRKVFALHGEMGAGKTTLVHAICDQQGVTEAVSSPTFSIINQYKAANGSGICHIDLYRLKDEEEAIQTGVEDCLYSGNQCWVEWPLRAPDIFPADTVQLYISTLDADTRKLEIKL